MTLARLDPYDRLIQDQDAIDGVAAHSGGTDVAADVKAVRLRARPGGDAYECQAEAKGNTGHGCW